MMVDSALSEEEVISEAGSHENLRGEGRLETSLGVDVDKEYQRITDMDKETIESHWTLEDEILPEDEQSGRTDILEGRQEKMDKERLEVHIASGGGEERGEMEEKGNKTQPIKD